MCQTDFWKLNRWFVVNSDVFYNFKQDSSQSSTCTEKFLIYKKKKAEKGTDLNTLHPFKTWAVTYKGPVLPAYNIQCFSLFYFHGANTVLFSQLFIPPPHPPTPC